MNSNRKICIVGLGYVGLPLAVLFGKKQHVIGFDINEKKIEELKQGVDNMGEVTKENLQETNVTFTSEAHMIQDADFIIVSVPTPIDNQNNPDLTLVKKASEMIGRNLKKDSIVVYESTVYPGVTEDVCAPILEKASNLKCGTDFKIGYSPERVNPGDKQHTIDKITKVVSGMDEESLNIISDVYGSIVTAGVFKAKNIKTAEAAKVIENIQRDLNIGLMNELSLIFQKIGISVYDVVEAAGTKWNFHKYYPGLVGGHCLSKNQLVFAKIDDEPKTLTIKELYELSAQSNRKKIQILSFDVKAKRSRFCRVTDFSKRKYSNLISFTTSTNQKMKVSDDHPMVIYEDDKFKVKHAKDVTLSDRFIISTELPELEIPDHIDLIETIDKKIISKIRVKPITGSFKECKEAIRKLAGKKSKNYFTWNYLPLSLYLKLEEKNLMPLKREEIFLATGRGPSFNKIRATLPLDEDFARLLGYYLSEGCVTKDKSLRTRWVFHSSEKEYIRDVRSCIKKLGCSHSIFNSKKDKATHIKLSSNIFGRLLLDTLKCGKDSYDAKIPGLLMFSSKELKKNLLKGLLRGDGGVSLYQDDNKAYVKKGKKYVHRRYSCEVNFFSISRILFNQVVLLLQDFGITASFDKVRPLLVIHGHKNLRKLRDLFLGDKWDKINNYFTNKAKFITSKKYEVNDGFLAVSLKNISKEEDDYVYSLEVEGTKTIITDYGLVTHNCIGVDPYYLVHKAHTLGYHPKMIAAARAINDDMHKNIAEITIKGLIKADKIIRNSKVLILGLTFKENVNDPRNSRVKHLIKELKDYGLDVVAMDPNLSKELVKEEFGVDNVSFEEVGRDVDAVIMATPHKEFKEIYEADLKTKMTVDAILVDIKNFYSEEKCQEIGITYYGL